MTATPTMRTESAAGSSVFESEWKTSEGVNRKKTTDAIGSTGTGR